MKKSEPARDYKFSDARLITIIKEKVAYIKRDALPFENYGITIALIADLENSADAFSDFITDLEALSDQSIAGTTKSEIAELLREKIRAVMVRAALKFTVNSAKYRKFGTEALSKTA